MDPPAWWNWRSLRTRYPGPVGLAIALQAFEVITYTQRYFTGMLDGLPVRLAVALHGLRALVLVLVVVSPRTLPRRAAVVFGFLSVQVVLMSIVADSADTTMYSVALISGVSVLFASFSAARQSVVVAVLAGISVAVVVYPTTVAAPLAISQSAFAGAIFAASPSAVAWFRHNLHEARSQAEVLAETDALTGLLNRRGAIARIPSLVSAAQRQEGQVVALAMDLDHFKNVNDVHGHAVGDQVLIGTAGALQSCLRKADIVSRIGGEEFIALLNTSAGSAVTLAERVRAAVPEATVPHEVTVSIGVAASTPPPAGTVDPVDWALRLLEDADRLLYQAKDTGRNLVLARVGDSTGGPSDELVSN